MNHPPLLTYTTKKGGIRVFVTVCAQLKICRPQPLKALLPKKNSKSPPPLSSPPLSLWCVLPLRPPLFVSLLVFFVFSSSSFPPPHSLSLSVSSSLYSLFVGCAARILGLHDVRKLWGSGEGLDPQLLEWIIWGERQKTEGDKREIEKEKEKEKWVRVCVNRGTESKSKHKKLRAESLKISSDQPRLS